MGDAFSKPSSIQEFELLIKDKMVKKSCFFLLYKHLYVLIHISTKGEVGAPLNQ